jgi:hypothetical protein
LRRAVPHEAAWLALRDPERRIHTPPATGGHATPLRALFATPEADAEVELLGLDRRRPPMLVSDLPAPLARVRVGWPDRRIVAALAITEDVVATCRGSSGATERRARTGLMWPVPV